MYSYRKKDFIAALEKYEKWPKCPSKVEWLKKFWHIQLIKYYAPKEEIQFICTDEKFSKIYS